MATKEEVLADESKFQDACRKYVSENIIYCASSLMYDVIRNAEESAKIFDEDVETIYSWGQIEDWSTPVEEHIANADLEDLEDIANNVGWWDDILSECNVPEVEEYLVVLDEDEDDTGWCFRDSNGERHNFDDEDEAIEAARMSVIDTIREKVSAAITYDDEYREIADMCGLDPDQHEVYEHWIVDSYFADRELAPRGELIFNFANFTIWGRCTTGQAILLDGVIRDIVRDLHEDHWLWKEL